jgi:REP element-mobilizing transposase RayT
MTTNRLYRSSALRRGRYSEIGRAYLVTTLTRQRTPVFRATESAITCARILHRAPQESAVRSLAWVIMPDHVHWLFTLEGDSLGVVMRRFKSRSARAVNQAAGTEGPFWQSGYHDRAIREEEYLRAVARYVVGNPLRAGLCNRVIDYPYWDAAWL